MFRVMITKALELAKYICVVLMKDKVIFITNLLLMYFFFASVHTYLCFEPLNRQCTHVLCRGHVRPVLKSELDTGMCPCMIYDKAPLYV